MSGEDVSSGTPTGVWPSGDGSSPIKHDCDRDPKSDPLHAQDGRTILSRSLQPDQLHLSGTSSTANPSGHRRHRGAYWLSLAEECSSKLEQGTKQKGAQAAKGGAATENEVTEAKRLVLKKLLADIDGYLQHHGFVATCSVVARHYPKEAIALLGVHEPHGGTVELCACVGQGEAQRTVKKAAWRILHIYLPKAVILDYAKHISVVGNPFGHRSSDSGKNVKQGSTGSRPIIEGQETNESKAQKRQRRASSTDTTSEPGGEQPVDVPPLAAPLKFVPRVVPGIAIKVPIRLPTAPPSSPAEQNSASPQTPRRSTRLEAARNVMAVAANPPVSKTNRKSIPTNTPRPANKSKLAEPDNNVADKLTAAVQDNDKVYSSANRRGETTAAPKEAKSQSRCKPKIRPIAPRILTLYTRSSKPGHAEEAAYSSTLKAPTVTSAAIHHGRKRAREVTHRDTERDELASNDEGPSPKVSRKRPVPNHPDAACQSPYAADDELSQSASRPFRKSRQPRHHREKETAAAAAADDESRPSIILHAASPPQPSSGPLPLSQADGYLSTALFSGRTWTKAEIAEDGSERERRSRAPSPDSVAALNVAEKRKLKAWLDGDGGVPWAERAEA